MNKITKTGIATIVSFGVGACIGSAVGATGNVIAKATCKTVTEKLMVLGGIAILAWPLAREATDIITTKLVEWIYSDKDGEQETT